MPQSLTLFDWCLAGLLLFTMTLAGYKAMRLGQAAKSLRKGVPLDPTLGSGLHLLALITTAAPFLGLTGTVSSIIDALTRMGGNTVSVAAVAVPVGHALLATQLGLYSAVIALASHHMLTRWLHALLRKAGHA